MEFRDILEGGRLDNSLGPYPWTQYRGYELPRRRKASPPPDENTLAGMDLDDNEAENDQPTSPPSSSDSETIGSWASDEVNDELNVLAEDNKTFNWDAWRADQAFEKAIADLEEVERKAPTVYDPDEVVSLVTEFYELMVNMGHWPLDALFYPPHSINIPFGKELGYDDAVLDLMQKLPYVDPRCNRHGTYVVNETIFANYTSDEDLERGRHPSWGNKDEPRIEGHMLAIAYPASLYGWLILLDTKLGMLDMRPLNNIADRFRSD